MKHKLPEWIPLVGKKAKKLGLEVDVLGNMRSSFNQVIDEHLEKNKAQERKNTPIYTGVLAYFPDALAEVCKASQAGNKQHLDGTPLHWDRTKSMDQMDSLTRHLIDCAKGIEFDDDGVRHLAKVAWRALAQLQLIIEKK